MKTLTVWWWYWLLAQCFREIFPSALCWEASVEFLTTHGDCLNIHTTMVLFQQFQNTVSWISIHCQKAIVILMSTLKKTDDLPHLAFVIQTRFKSYWKDRGEKVLQWRRQAQQPDGWHFTILHHHMKPCSSIYEEEQMVEASHPSFYSLQSNDPQRRWRCLLVIPQMERATQKQLADTGSHDLRDKLIRQCLQCYAAHKGNVICSQLVAFYQCSLLTRQIVPE